MLRNVRCAQLDEAVFERLASSFEDRFRALRLLARAHFPPERSGRLWDFLGDDLPSVPVPRAGEGEELSERALEEHLEQHWAETPFARGGVELARREAHGWPCRQVFTPVNSIDLLGSESKARRWWVFELKRGRSADRVVGQVSRYLVWIGEERRGNPSSPVQLDAGKWKLLAVSLLYTERTDGEYGEPLLTVRRVAELLGVSTAAVYARCANGTLRHIRVGSAIRVAFIDLEEFVEEHSKGPPPRRPRPFPLLAAHLDEGPSADADATRTGGAAPQRRNRQGR